MKKPTKSEVLIFIAIGISVLATLFVPPAVWVN
jgi:hypothetical protein